MNFEAYRRWVVQEALEKHKQRFKIKEGIEYDFAQERDYQALKEKQEEIELARHLNISNSFVAMIEQKSDTTMLFITGTFGSKFRVERYSQSVGSITNHLRWQVKSSAFFLRKLFKSKRFKRLPHRKCGLHDPLEYLWTIELQSDGNIHFHLVVFLNDDEVSVKHFVKRFHELRAKYCRVMKVKDSGNSLTVLPLGRCHIGLHPQYESAMRELSAFETKADPKNHERKHHFLVDISHIETRTGEGTVVEFYTKKRFEDAYRDTVAYINKILEAKHTPMTKESIMRGIAHQTMVEHHTKGVTDKYSNEKLKVDAMIFSHIGVRIIHYSQILFPTSLYQTIRKELMTHKKGYRSLYTLTIDMCKGYIEIIGKAPYRTIEYKGKEIAQEQRWKENSYSIDDDVNDYKLAKEGV